jgi:hypothetical protein
MSFQWSHFLIRLLVQDGEKTVDPGGFPQSIHEEKDCRGHKRISGANLEDNFFSWASVARTTDLISATRGDR